MFRQTHLSASARLDEKVTEPFTLETDAQGRFTLKRPAQDDVVDVRLRRAFPWTRPSQSISIRNKDGKEVLLIEDLADLAPDVRQTVEAYLSSGCFIPRIQRILEVDLGFGFQEWRTMTDRGPAEFRVQEREDIRFMPDGRFSVKDADGNLYELPALGDLAEESRKAVEGLI